MMNTSMDKMRNLAPIVVRIGIALVLLWFGSEQISNTSMWIRLIPDWATSMSGMGAATLVTLNGTFEIIFGIALFVGFFTRITALFLALHLLSIAFAMGYTGIGVRDFGLSMATVSIFLYGADSWCLDSFLKKRKRQANII